MAHVLQELELFPSDQHYMRAIRMLEEAGFADKDHLSPKLQIGIKKLLSIVEMARQEPGNVAERLTHAIMDLHTGM
jgi:vesicle-fusing ATPase